MAKSSKKKKPGKPYPEFPLYSHASGRWAKKIKGKTHYFGPWDDPEGALERFQRTVHDLQAGRTPVEDSGDLSVLDMVNLYLDYKEGLVKTNELSQRTWDESLVTCKRLVELLGRDTSVAKLRPSDFALLRAKLAKGWGLQTLSNEIARIKACFNYAWQAELIEAPVRFGMEFKKPSKKALKRESLTRAAKIFEKEELIAVYEQANQVMRTFILLGLNGGMGATDIGLLEPKHVQGGGIKFPRPKTAVDREFPLWSETVKAMEASRQTKGLLPYYFATKRGLCWAKGTGDSPVSKEFRKLCIAAKCHAKGRGFYSLRHQFRTVADSSRDTPAINRIMGHQDSSMGARYTEWIDPERLQAVVDHVRQWCLPIFG
ncbi:MAG: hypothetical protein Aurels2KO_54530 [Aureliella sp.]